MVTVSSVVNASKGELLCITYELLLEAIELGEKSQDVGERKRHIKKAIEIIQMLVGDLNFEYELSKELFRIYVYVQGLLVNAKKNEQLEEAYRLINKLYEGFKKVAEQEEAKKPSMENAEAIYAGFTYGKDSIHEISVGRENRGFKA